jgi:hypothetical protein
MLMMAARKINEKGLPIGHVICCGARTGIDLVDV